MVPRRSTASPFGCSPGGYLSEEWGFGTEWVMPPQADSPRRRRRRPFRKDIEGLRAVAILAVVLYHAHVGAVPGGYVGVDVFFVISGYLITDHLWREVRDRGHVSFGAFYARRIRRLLPASFLVLAVTALASAAILPPLEARSVLKDGIACALYVGNYRFAILQTNYLTASAPPSPFQNYWSLGVEEQFYLIWPAVLLLTSLAWKLRRPSRTVATAALAAIAIVSCSYSIWLTHANQPWAFFSLPTRAWELAVGGLIALGAPAIGRLRALPLVSWLGFGMILWSVIFFTAATPFPGTAALVPVLGTAAVIAAGCGSASERGAVQLLRTSPMQVMGRVSYSWYLWHWPMLILVPAALGHALSLAQNLTLAALSFVVAAITFIAVERPVRNSSWLTSRPRRSLSLGAALSVAAVCACVLSVLALPTLTGTGRAPVAAAALRASTRAVVLPASRSNPTLTQLYEGTAAINQEVQRSVTVKDVPTNLEPSLPDAQTDEPPVFVNGCLDSYTDTSLRPCVSGDSTGATTVVLFGDSHASMWFPAVNAAAQRYGWRLITWTKATCPPFPLPISSPVLGRTFTECDQWRADVLDQMAQIHPALVIFGVARHYTGIYGFTPYSPVWLSGLGQEVSAVRNLGAEVMVLGPVPKPPFDVPGCLSTHLTDATSCTVPLGVGLDESGMAAEDSAVSKNGGTYLDTQPWFCTLSTCAVVVDNLVVYRDDNHLTQAYASFLAPVMGPAMQRALAGQPVVNYAEKPQP
jgi:peptidoglycan/LPS O-acetylase OafA/YrhL